MLKKKSLGQNFLKSPKIVSDIVSAGKVMTEDTVLEIGPGEGVMTAELLKQAKKVIVIEKDHRLIPILQEKFKNETASGKLEIIEGDILEINIEVLMAMNLDAIRGENEDCDQAVPDSTVRGATGVIDKEVRQIHSHYKVVANIPYYITGQIIRKFLEAKNKPASMTLLVQKEVAERIVARDKKESLLSLSVKVFGDPKIIRTVGRGAFSPAPNVDSAVINIENISNKNLAGLESKDFFSVLHSGFAHKRKQLLPNLSNDYPKEKVISAFEKIGLDLKSRAEDLPLEIWLKLSKILVV